MTTAVSTIAWYTVLRDRVDGCVVVHPLYMTWIFHNRDSTNTVSMVY